MKNLNKIINLLLQNEENRNIILPDQSKINMQDLVEYYIRDLVTRKIFVVDEQIAEILFQTDTDIKVLELPFKRIFIDISIKQSNYEVYGILIEKIKKAHHPQKIDDTLIDLYFKNKNTNEWGACNFTMITEGLVGKNIGNTKELIYDDTNHPDLNIRKRINKSDVVYKLINKKIKKFVINFLRFLNEPEVTIVEVKRTEEQNAKRIQRGKIPIPTMNYVKVTGKLKIYLDKLESQGAFRYSHKFWVRGHWRTLRDKNRYGKNTGKKMWIKPHIKGEGILIEKTYSVKGDTK